MNSLPLKLNVIDSKNGALTIAGTSINLIIVRSLAHRTTGLLNHLSLPASEGLVLTRSHLIHTFGMRFPIVVLGFDRHGNQVDVAKLVMPNSIVKLPIRSKFVVEISASHAPVVNAYPASSLPKFLCNLLKLILRA